MFYRTILLQLIIVLTPSFILCQEIDWEQNYGGSDNDKARDVQETNDGGFIVAGFSYSNDSNVTNNYGNWDYWVVKLDSSGGIEWENNYGGSDYDEAHSIEQTMDNGFIVVGVTSSNDSDIVNNNGMGDFWVVKLNNSGSIEWNKNYGGSGSDIAYEVRQISDSGFIVGGRSESSDFDVSNNNGGEDYWVIKLNDTGKIVWDNNYGGSDNERFHSIQQTTDKGYILAGWSKSNDLDVSSNFGKSDYWVVKTDSNGAMVWEQNYGGSLHDEAHSIQQTDNDGFIIGGESESFDHNVSNNKGGNDYWIVKLNDTGKIIWENNYGGSGGDQAFSIQQTINGGYAISGHSSSSDGDVTGNYGSLDYWLVELDSIGNLVWEFPYGGSQADKIPTLELTSNNHYIMAGNSESDDINVSNNFGSNDYWVIKINDTTSAVSNDTSGGGGGSGCNEETSAAFGYSKTGLTVNFEDQSLNSASWYWDFDDSNSDTVQSPSHTYSQEDLYTVCLKTYTQSECDSDIVCSTIDLTNTSTSIKQVTDKQILIYPNPTKDKINIEIRNNLANGTFQLKNIHGKTVKSIQNLAKGETSLSLSNLSSGLYFYKVINKEALVTTGKITLIE